MRERYPSRRNTVLCRWRQARRKSENRKLLAANSVSNRINVFSGRLSWRAAANGEYYGIENSSACFILLTFPWKICFSRHTIIPSINCYSAKSPEITRRALLLQSTKRLLSFLFPFSVLSESCLVSGAYGNGGAAYTSQCYQPIKILKKNTPLVRTSENVELLYHCDRLLNKDLPENQNCYRIIINYNPFVRSSCG